MGCFLPSEDDTSASQQPDLAPASNTLKAMLAAKQPPLRSPCRATRILQRKLGFVTRRTLRARSRLLDTASRSLARVKLQKSLTDICSNNNTESSSSLLSENKLFPLPLPPGYNSTNANPHPNSNSNPNSNSISPKALSSGALTPSSSTSSSGAPSSSSSSSLSLQSFNTHAFQARELRSNSMPLPLPCPNKNLHLSSSSSSSLLHLIEFSPRKIKKACQNFHLSHKLRDGPMGPLYRATLPLDHENTFKVIITRVETDMNSMQWKAHVQCFTSLNHSNLCKVLGFSYEKSPKEVRGSNVGYIVWEDRNYKNLYESISRGHVQKEKIIFMDWQTRVKIAIGIAEGLSFLLQRVPKQNILFGNFKMENIFLDALFNPKLCDFVFVSPNDEKPYYKGSSATTFDVQEFGIILLQLFNFSSYPQDGDGQLSPLHFQEGTQTIKSSSSKDAKLIIDLAASCLLPDPSLRPSMQYVTRILRSIHGKNMRSIKLIPLYKRRCNSFS